MNIVLSTSSNTPIYQQLTEQLQAQIMRGELKSGEVLPPIRTVAKELRISIITVKKAWEQLEREGFIDTMVGRGSFVAGLTPSQLADKRSTLINSKIAKDIAYYKEMGLTLEEILEAVSKFF
jgi:GntR family transcriptional regulator